ncbi:Separase [Vitis vinifera]|uniref:separase n=1 Tax=Vitis vinifera TaxID=29760 RepID=A0A438GIZ6_VITVI|nr:Separase [Vitis vinifera]
MFVLPNQLCTLDASHALRLAPESLQGLEEFVMKFFEDLPYTTVICISLLGEVSDDDASSESGIHYEHKDLDKQWHCPWGSTVVDDVAPAFKTILEENYLSSSTFPLDDTKENRLQWWTQRKKLDHRLGKLLRCKVFSNPCDRVEKKSALANQLISGAAEELEEEESVNREPIILVLDCEMLPWENIPVLRTQEVYHMPSIGSISAILDRSHHHQEQAGMNAAAFPLIDPLDAFYLLNPSGDLSSSQAAFEKWFRDQNIEGKAGIAPTVEELAGALKRAQYIPRHEIQKLENCAATLLMGCIANLWEVTDKDIDRFGKAMLDAWLRERSSPSMACAQCRLVPELKSMSITRGKGDAKKKIPRKKVSKACSSVVCEDYCNHRPKIGSFMSQAREACTLPFLIGASPVCVL